MYMNPSTVALKYALGETIDGPILDLPGVDATGWVVHWSVAAGPGAAHVLDMSTTGGQLSIVVTYTNGVPDSEIRPRVEASTTALLSAGSFQHDCFATDAAGTRIVLLGIAPFEFYVPITQYP